MKTRVLAAALTFVGLAAMPIVPSLAIPTGSGSASTGASVVGITTPEGAVSLTGEVYAIPANGIAHRVANIVANDEDTDYQLRIDPGAITVLSQGQSVGSCGTLPPVRYSIVEQGLPLTFTHNYGPTELIGKLMLTIPSSASNNCIVRKAVVQVVFTAVGADVP